MASSMSLTTGLNDPHSRIARFLRRNFPATSSTSRRYNPGIYRLPTIKPKAEYSVVEYTLVGTAVDYRVRFALGPMPLRKTAAYRGARFLVSEGVASATLVKRFFSSLDEFTDAAVPYRNRLSAENERQLARFCLVLAHLERADRTEISEDTIFDLVAPRSANPRALLALAVSSHVADVVELAIDVRQRLPAGTLRFNPTFAGSVDVGGADGDLIIDRCLVEIKTTTNPGLTRKRLFQLLGYALLDYKDRYRIDSLGVYWARQRHFSVWKLLELLPMLTGSGHNSLKPYRSAFAAHRGIVPRPPKALRPRVRPAASREQIASVGRGMTWEIVSSIVPFTITEVPILECPPFRRH